MIKQFQDKSPIIPKSCYISESVDIIGNVTLGEEVNVWFGTVIRGDMNFIRIGERTNIQDNCTVHVTTDTAPTVIGNNVTIGHNAIIHGCKIEDGCLIGMGSIIMDNAQIGEGSIIGAGSVITENSLIPPRSLCLGIPGKIIRQVTDKEYAGILERAEHYVQFSKKYLYK
ncbi:MAG: gamma carbonic anhydrase family protein [Candidatus Marinimicrobia bacterium]|nr:gamma carbonic anhydrase family protein [Candidatus Neomarinimicrobiota bacterium]MBL7022805.1 gamma carbonic anhydrase family protein [Candidatus Neomarinimicrobiota bacterium]MBL7109372.1 gamma carbonic anhydrase family protein [Candidatus Neomarinimicrobiota bacterium]